MATVIDLTGSPSEGKPGQRSIIDVSADEPARAGTKRKVVTIDEAAPAPAPPQAEVEIAATMLERIGGPRYRGNYGKALKRCRNMMSARPNGAVLTAEDVARDLARRAGAPGDTFECSCCFDEAPLLDAVQCSEGCIFCSQCVRRYANESVFGAGKGAIDRLKCMTSATACAGVFVPAELKKALPASHLAKLHETAAVAAARAAAVQLFACPKCGVSCDVSHLAPSERRFYCPQAGCGHAACRECGEAPHGASTTCESQSETAKRRKVEEAMTSARLRACPKCQARFFKADGCNKMTCPCGEVVCYLCVEKITNGYDHFCQTPHCDHSTCTKCRLFSDADEDHRAMRRAAVAHDGGAGRVNALLEQGPAPRPRPPAAAAAIFVGYQQAVDAYARVRQALAWARQEQQQQQRPQRRRPRAARPNPPPQQAPGRDGARPPGH